MISLENGVQNLANVDACRKQHVQTVFMQPCPEFLKACVFPSIEYGVSWLWLWPVKMLKTQLMALLGTVLLTKYRNVGC